MRTEACATIERVSKVATVKRKSARVAAAILAVVFVARHALGETTGPTLLLGVVPDLIWVVLILCATLMWRGGQPRKGWVFAIGIVGMLAFLEPGLPSVPTGASSSITVLQLNMQHGLSGQEGIARLIRERQPDVIFLQETGPLDQLVPTGPLVEALKDYNLSNATTMPLTGQHEVIAVKGPILRNIDYDLPELPGESLPRGKHLTAVEIEVGGRKLIVATVHLSPTQDAASKVSRVRSEQLRRVAAFIEAQEHSVILAGDFNSPPHGPGYRRMSAVATDLFRSRGVGFGWTITARLPLRRIDYIWFKGALIPLECHVVDDIVSDHRAVWGRFGLPEPSN